MAFYHSLLSRLFGGDPAEEASPPEQAVDAEIPQAPTPDPRLLQLPPDHVVYRLWDLRVRQKGWLPQPAFRLAERPDLPPALDDEEVRKELLRLQLAVNSSANSRLMELGAPKAPAGDGGEPAVPDLDAQAVVFTTLSGMAAWLLIYPPSGEGREIDRELLDRALAGAGVRFGVDEALLDSLPQNPDRYFHLFPCAQGKPAVHGVDGRVVDLFSRVVERTVTVDEMNRVDYTTLNFIQNVAEGEIICRLIPPTEGVPGRTVLDQPLPARDGRKAALPKGRNTRISEDSFCLLAAIAGHVEFSGRAFQVKPLLDIPANVDFSTGDINFLGDVCIHGDICGGFTVRAMGNINVGGVVEAATVEAGGDLVVAGGVQGDNQAIIRAQRSIFAKFIENSCVYVKDTLHADCLINCDVYCDGGVEVRSGRMTVIGGSLRAAHEVSAGMIGSRAECRTEIFLGGQPCGEFEHHILLQEIAEQEKELEKTERQPDSPLKLSRMSKLRMQLMVNRKKLEQLEKERETLAEEQEAPGLRRMMCSTVYPGVVLSIDGVAHHFEHKLSPCSATLADGEIQLI